MITKRKTSGAGVVLQTVIVHPVWDRAQIPSDTIFPFKNTILFGKQGGDVYAGMESPALNSFSFLFLGEQIKVHVDVFFAVVHVMFH